MTDRTYRCQAVEGTTRCAFTGDNEAAAAHWQETGHARCIVCRGFLGPDERQTCQRCVGRVRTDLADIVECVAVAPSVIEGGGYRGLLVDLLAYVSDGSIESPVQQANPQDYADVEWPGDPWPVVAVLWSIEHVWRAEFGHRSDAFATVSSCAAYLAEQTGLAARTWEGFGDDARTLGILASRLRHATGRADDPARGRVRCSDCPEVALVQPYRPPVVPVPHPRRHGGREGLEREGREDVWSCPHCHREYTPAEYGLAMRMQAADAQEWVRVSLAADLTGRRRQVIWQWAHTGQVDVATDEDGHVVVWMPDVRDVHHAVTRRRSAVAG